MYIHDTCDGAAGAAGAAIAIEACAIEACAIEAGREDRCKSAPGTERERDTH